MTVVTSSGSSSYLCFKLLIICSALAWPESLLKSISGVIVNLPFPNLLSKSFWSLVISGSPVCNSINTSIVNFNTSVELAPVPNRASIMPLTWLGTSLVFLMSVNIFASTFTSPVIVVVSNIFWILSNWFWSCIASLSPFAKSSFVLPNLANNVFIDVISLIPFGFTCPNKFSHILASVLVALAILLAVLSIVWLYFSISCVLANSSFASLRVLDKSPTSTFPLLTAVSNLLTACSVSIRVSGVTSLKSNKLSSPAKLDLSLPSNPL